jgi:hypothetical protein
MRRSQESRILAGLCLADLVSTLILIEGYGAEEANFVLCFYLNYGLLAFIGVKCLLFVPALLIAECYRPHYPLLVSGLLRLVICLYVCCYSAGVYAINHVPTPQALPSVFRQELQQGGAAGGPERVRCWREAEDRNAVR